jgi:DNA mismatch endonuclease, patch repair protein
MADVFNKEKRSQIMRQVKSNRNKSTELKLISFFKSYSIKGWRRNINLYGKPDFVFPKTRTVIFVDGCFWHGHDCRNTKPKDNAEYWTLKIIRNKKRDKDVSKKLTKLGWKVIRIWECELKRTGRLIKHLKGLHE